MRAEHFKICLVLLFQISCTSLRLQLVKHDSICWCFHCVTHKAGLVGVTKFAGCCYAKEKLLKGWWFLMMGGVGVVVWCLPIKRGWTSSHHELHNTTGTLKFTNTQTNPHRHALQEISHIYILRSFCCGLGGKMPVHRTVEWERPIRFCKWGNENHIYRLFIYLMRLTKCN